MIKVSICLSHILPVCASIILYSVVSACTKNSNSHSSKSESRNNEPYANKRTVRNSVPEWYAFAVFHPESSLAEGNFSSDISKSSNAKIKNSVTLDSKNNNTEFSIVLGAKSLIPILRSTFGNQPRSGGEVEEDSWFTTHPSDLFTPDELLSLCTSSRTSELESTDDYCWKPKVTQQYLATLSNFAADACNKLVEAERKKETLSSNKILRSKVFSGDDLKYFTIRHLRMERYDVTDGWIKKILNDAETFLREELQLEPPQTVDAIKVHSIEKAIFACRAALTSKEFYTR